MAKQTKGWLDNYGEEANANEGSSSAPKGWMGEGYSNVGRKYSPAWGGQFQLGGNIIPGTYVPQAQKGKKVIVDGKEYDTSSDEYKDLYRWGPNDDGKGGIGYFDEQGRLVTGKTTMPEVVVWNKDKKTKEFYDNLYESDQWAMDQMIKKYGPVSVEKSDDRGTGIFSKASGSYNPLSNKIKIYNRFNSDPKDVFISELAHKVQFDKQGKFDVIGDWMFNDLPDYITGKSPYQDPSTVEHEAHEMYEPKLSDEFSEYSHQDLMGTNYNKFLQGGSLPGSVGFMYARTNSPAPSNGPYAKKTKASAQNGKKLSYDQWMDKYNLEETPDYNLKRAWELGYTPDETGHLPTVDNETGQFLKAKGHPTIQKELDWYNSPEGADFKSKNTIDSSGKFFKYIPKGQNGQEMSYYQHGLDWKPKTISKKGSVIKDNNGYWNPDNWGKVVEIDSPYITMQGVNQPLLGISDTGDVQYMEPGQDYEYDGNKVTEFPIMRGGGLMKAQNGFGCKGKSKCITGSDEKKKDGVSDSDGGGIGNYVPMSNAPATWEELQTYNETNPKSKEFKAQLKSLQGQFPGLTAQQLLAAGADSARVNLRKQNLQRYDQPSEQTFDRAYHMFYRPLMNQQNRVTVPQILQQQPGGFSNFEQNVRSNYGRTKNQYGGLTKAQNGLEYMDLGPTGSTNKEVRRSCGRTKYDAEMNAKTAKYLRQLAKEKGPEQLSEWEDITTPDKEEKKVLKEQFKLIKDKYPGLDFNMFVAANRDAGRTNVQFGQPERYGKYFDPETGEFLRNTDTRNVDDYMRFYRKQFPKQTKISATDVLDVYNKMPGGLSNYERYVNEGYFPYDQRPPNQMYGGVTKQTKKVNQNESQGWLSQYK